jgi:hypothetical protein
MKLKSDENQNQSLATPTEEHQDQNPSNQRGLGSTHAGRNRTGREVEPLLASGASRRPGSEQGGDASSYVGDHPHRGLRSRTTSELKTLLDNGFASGDPEVVWGCTQEVLREFDRLEQDSAKLRFQVNFGTSVCNRCEGLTAGPGVVATCFQVKQCRYTNVKDTGLDQIIESLIK